MEQLTITVSVVMGADTCRRGHCGCCVEAGTSFILEEQQGVLKEFVAR
jgi:hypothetical protein